MTRSTRNNLQPVPDGEEAEQTLLSNKKEQTAATNDNLGGPHGCEESLSHTPCKSNDAASFSDKMEDGGDLWDRKGLCLVAVGGHRGLHVGWNCTDLHTHECLCSVSSVQGGHITPTRSLHAVTAIPEGVTTGGRGWTRIQGVFALFSVMHVHLQVSQNSKAQRKDNMAADTNRRPSPSALPAPCGRILSCGDAELGLPTGRA